MGLQLILVKQVNLTETIWQRFKAYSVSMLETWVMECNVQKKLLPCSILLLVKQSQAPAIK
jgi:hypothetical protein